MTTKTEEFFLDDPWKLISAPCYPEARRLYLKDERFWVSRDERSQILFFVQGEGIHHIKPLENIDGISISIEKSGSNSTRLICTLTAPESQFRDKFSIVAKDVAWFCSKHQGATLFSATQSRIKSWANFLKPSREGLSKPEHIGLLGELIVLDESFIPNLEVEQAINAWIGIEDKKQDFALGSMAFEVKSSASGDQRSITISSLDQLDKVTNSLYLVRVLVAPAKEEGGYSLNSLRSSVVSKIDHDLLAERMFLQKVSEAYGKATEAQLAESFDVIDINLYEVSEEFPRISRANVHVGIAEAKYQIFLDSLTDFELSKSIEEVLNGE